MAAQLTLFANPDMSEPDCKTASRLCANALPIVFSACTGGRYRQWALNLLAVSDLKDNHFKQVLPALTSIVATEISGHRRIRTYRMGRELWHL
jgi:hypothetical protein